jgi:hypothetical protein
LSAARVAGFGREENQLADGNDALVVLSSPTLNVVDPSASRKLLPSTVHLPGPRLILLGPVRREMVLAMELFTRLFGQLLAFVYHCFDRIVIHGYLTRLSRPEHVVHFFREFTTKYTPKSDDRANHSGMRSPHREFLPLGVRLLQSHQRRSTTVARPTPLRRGP